MTYRQLYRGVPVLGGYYVEHLQHDGSVRVDDGRIAVTSPPPAAGWCSTRIRSSLQNENLTDQGDAASAVPAAAYRRVQLPHLDGSGYLYGRYAAIALSTDKQAYSPTNTFNYNRQNDHFEQVESYYAVDSAQVYFQSLGFTDVNTSRRTSSPTRSVRTTPSTHRARTRSRSGPAAWTTPRTPR